MLLRRDMTDVATRLLRRNVRLRADRPRAHQRSMQLSCARQRETVAYSSSRMQESSQRDLRSGHSCFLEEIR